MYCSREYQLTSRFNQQYEKSTSNEHMYFYNVDVTFPVNVSSNKLVQSGETIVS